MNFDPKSWIASVNWKYIIFRFTGIVGLICFTVGLLITKWESWDKLISVVLAVLTVFLLFFQHKTLKETHKLNEKVYLRANFPELTLRNGYESFIDPATDEKIGAKILFKIINTGIHNVEISNFRIKIDSKVLEYESQRGLKRVIDENSWPHCIKIIPAASIVFKLVVLDPVKRHLVADESPVSRELLPSELEKLHSSIVRFVCDDHLGQVHYGPWVDIKIDFNKPAHLWNFFVRTQIELDNAKSSK